MKINVLSSYSLFVFFTFENKLFAHVKSNFKKFFCFCSFYSQNICSYKSTARTAFPL